MATQERRAIMGLEDVYTYCRELEATEGRPILFKLTQAIRTLDYAIDSSAQEYTDESSYATRVSSDAWSRVRDQLFTKLITAFEGAFVVYADGEDTPREFGGEWPQTGFIEFYPSRLGRRNDLFKADLSRLDPSVLVCLRWSFADNCQHITPANFVTDYEPYGDAEESEREQATRLLQQMYNICEAEAAQGKKNAHRRWLQLYWEADSCTDRSEKHEIQKQMNHLQAMWGRPDPAKI